MEASWDQMWKWATDHYIYQTFVVIAVFVLLVFPGRVGIILGKLLGRYKKIKAGLSGIELETQDQKIDPNTPCPYVKSRDIAFDALRELNTKVDSMTADAIKTNSMLKNLYIDFQKKSFYDRDQPEPERLAGGLKYLYEGGNGDTKKDVVEFAQSHKVIYDTLVYEKPELRLKN
jgi:hypothetical protein